MVLAKSGAEVEASVPVEPTMNGKSHVHLNGVDSKDKQEEDRDTRIGDAVSTILECIDPDSKRDGLIKTPKRVAKSLQFLTSGYDQDIDVVINEALFDTSDEDVDRRNGNSMGHDVYTPPIIVKDIDLFSLCEHHMLPFCGKATVAYKPAKGKVIGLSKIARIIDIFARRLQLQERLTEQISECIAKATRARGVAVIIEAT